MQSPEKEDSALLFIARSDRDSNSGTACDGYTLSRNTSFSHKPLIISVYNFVVLNLSVFCRFEPQLTP